MVKCAKGYFCFQEITIYLLVLSCVIVLAYMWHNRERLTRVLKDTATATQKMVTMVPINVPTRGPAPQYERIGTLHEINSPNDKRGKVLSLFGRQTYSGSQKWMYYTMTDQYNMIRLPVHNVQRKNCMESTGCSELYSDDIIYIDAYSGEFKVHLYIPQHPRYIPL